MNELTLFFYIADIIPRFGVTAVPFAIMCFIAAFVLWVVHFVCMDVKDREEGDRFQATIKTPRRWFTFLFVLLVFIAIITPSKDTLYKMGASVVAGHIVQMEEVQQLGGEIGGLATDTIKTLRQHIQSTLPETIND